MYHLGTDLSLISRYYYDTIRVLFRYYQGTIRVLSRYYPHAPVLIGNCWQIWKGDGRDGFWLLRCRLEILRLGVDGVDGTIHSFEGERGIGPDRVADLQRRLSALAMGGLRRWHEFGC